MKSIFFFLLAAMVSDQLIAQPGSQKQDSSWKKNYRESSPKINDLIHTKLELKPDYSKSYLYGKAWITLKPHFYPTDSLTLDAKGMEFHKIAVVKGGQQKELKYTNNDWQVKIQLDKTYKWNENYTIYIDYTAKPDEFDAKFGGGQMLGIKGMYFINPRGEDKDKPTQIWTQGETESNSGWFPTIDKPNQKSTEELTVTVPAKYVTLSNGILVSQKKNADGTRTDYWKMDLPHAPYLFFLGVGDYAIVKDHYKNKEVNYYVEPEYASTAKKIFGNTPEMIAFYSKITGVDYPWAKYDQITGRDFVAGAMENTTATLHQESAQQNARELVDGNGWESTIAHELFHQWFGDYVTTESWSNITLNESFANYSETLWSEYKYGKDAGDEQNYMDMQGYLQSNSEKKDLVRFFYNDKEDVFDGVSYNKGGRILHMLRNFVGDSAFFKALNLYLTTNKFKSAEAQQLRLAFEEVTGKDLNWYWNQWYYGSGHPKLDINYSYDENAKKVQVIVNQTQAGDRLFKLPVMIGVYKGGNKTKYQVWVKNKVDTFSFSSATNPDLINFDDDKVLLTQKTENKTLDNYIYQYRWAGSYLDRREAIDAVSKKQDDPKAVEFLKTALKDKYEGLRSFTLNRLDMKNENLVRAVEPVLVDLAKNDPKRLVKATAIAKLGQYKKSEYASLFKAAVNDSSYTVSGNALEALYKIDSAGAVTEAKRLAAAPSKGKLANQIKKIAEPVDGNKLLRDFEAMPLGQAKFRALDDLFDFLNETGSLELFKRGVDDILQIEKDIPEAFREQATTELNRGLREIQKEKISKGMKEQADYIDSKLPKEKGF
jgi:aminopeptidase N